jgi:hypothetical protein
MDGNGKQGEDKTDNDCGLHSGYFLSALALGAILRYHFRVNKSIVQTYKNYNKILYV